MSYNNRNYTQNTQAVVPYVNNQYTSHLPVLDPMDKEVFDKILAIHEIDGHVYVMASTRSGKTECVKLIQIRLVLNGKGSIVIFDPHGDLAKQTARMMFDKKKVVYIDPSLKNGITPTINPFRLKKSDERTYSIMAQEILNAFESIIGADFSPNMEALLIPCIYTLLRKGDSGVDELLGFMDDENNEYLIALGLQSPIKAHRDFFRNQFSKKKFEVTKNAIATKLQLLLNNPIFFNFMNGKSTINLEKLVNTDGKIIILRLPKDAMRKTLEPAAKLIMALIQGIVLKRANLPEEMRPKTCLILDEFQNLTSQTLREMLAESAKNNLSVICMHQYLSQIDTKTKDAVLSNTNVKIVGRNSHKDLKVMADEIEVDVSLLKNLKQGEFYIKVGNRDAVKVITSDKFLGDKEAISELQWKQHLKYWKKHYYKKVIDTTVVKSVDDNTVDNSNTLLPIPKFDIEE